MSPPPFDRDEQHAYWRELRVLIEKLKEDRRRHRWQQRMLLVKEIVARITGDDR